MFTRTRPPLKTYSRQKRRAVVELERGDARDGSSESDGDGSNIDIEQSRKRRRVGCLDGAGKVRPLSSAMKSVSSLAPGASSSSELSECACGATKKSITLKSSSSSLLPSSSSPRLREYGCTTTPPSSPPPLAASSSWPRVDDDTCKGGETVWLESECKGRKELSLLTDENISLSCEGVAVTNTSTSTSGTSKAKPLAPRSNNLPSKLLSSKPKPQVRPKKRNSRPRLTQLCIDLGNDVRRTCKICGMDYITSNPEDVALHKKFHSMNVGGIDVPRWFVDEARPKKLRKEGGDDKDASVAVVVVDRRDSFAARNVAMRVLDVANRELSAVQIDDAELWGRITLKGDNDDNSRHAGTPEKIGSEPGMGMRTDTERNAARLKRDTHDSKGRRADRYKVYLYLRGQKCVGLCLAERISKAYRIQSTAGTKETERSKQVPDASSIPASDTLSGTLSALPSPLTPTSHISLDEIPRPAIMGISRIWTSHSYRRKGVAKHLLDCAATSFLYGMTVEQNSIAFSQPTESGSQLARSWFVKVDGWHVYT